ncbi:hypothetical protein KA005_00855 [bacterium]|nr:hypothetical protein [bacterium]
MNEFLQAIIKLIEDGLNWQETIVSCVSIITTGFITWIVVTGLANVIKVAIRSIEYTFTAIFKGIKDAGHSLANVSSSNQPPKV